MDSLAQKILGQRQREESFRHPPWPARDALIEGQKRASRPVIVRGVAGMTSANSLAPHIELYGAVAERGPQQDLPTFRTPGLPGKFRMTVEPNPSQWFAIAEEAILRVAKPLPLFTKILDEKRESILKECVSITEAMNRKAERLIERNEQILAEIERIKSEAQAKGF